MFTPTPAEKAAAAPKRVPTGAEKFADASDKLTGSLEAATKALKAGKRDAKALAGIAAFAKQLPELDKGVQADFAKTRGILKKIKSADKDAIEAKVEKQYAERQTTLAGKLRTIASAETTAALRLAVTGTAKWLDDITPDAPYQPLGTELPHRIVNANAGPPVLGASIAPAYAPNLKGATPSTLPVTPTPEDTTQTIEVQFTEDISSLVTSLGADPVRMYEYVRNTIDFEPYYGSRKGANETLLEGSGNDMDTASLLIALYRKAGIPARYVSGVVDVPVKQAMNWVGVETPEAAAKLFASGGTPTKTMLSGGKPKALRIEHTWAEAYVPYEDYRGAGAGTGSNRWVPLDASFKEYGEASPLDIGGYLSPEQKSSFASVLSSAASVDTTGFIALDSPRFVSAVSTLTQESSAAVAAAVPAQGSRIAGQREPKALRTALLAGNTGLSVCEIASEWHAVPSWLIAVLSVRVETSEGHVACAYEVPLPGVGEKKIVLGFPAASPADREVMGGYASLEQVPAHLVRVRPALLVGDTVTLGQRPLQLGERAALRLDVSLCGETQPLCDTPVGAGGLYAAALNLGRVSVGEMRESASQVLEFASAASQRRPLPDITLGGFFGGLLHSVGLLYFGLIDGTQGTLANACGVRRFRQLSGLVTGTDMESTAVLGAPVGVRCPGLCFDVDSDASSGVVASQESSPTLVAYNLAAGAVASSTEGWLWHALFGVASQGISTVAVLRQCAAEGRPVVSVTADNANRVLASLELPAALVSEIRGRVAAGSVVTLPTMPAESGAWKGVAYVVTDPVTGNSGFMLSGGLAGGVSIWEALEQGVWLAFSGVMTGAAFNAGFFSNPMVSPTVQTAAFMLSIASMGLSLKAGLEAVEDVSDPAKRARYQAMLVGGFVTATVALEALLATGLMAEGLEKHPDMKGKGPAVSAACTMLSFVVAFGYWAFTAYLRMEMDLQ
jgi:transglutaminase-like putative cysteine protease